MPWSSCFSLSRERRDVVVARRKVRRPLGLQEERSSEVSLRQGEVGEEGGEREGKSLYLVEGNLSSELHCLFPRHLTQTAVSGDGLQVPA